MQQNLDSHRVHAMNDKHIDFQWMNTDEMAAFETVYLDWLEERISPTPRQPELDDKAQQIMNLLKHNH